MVYSMTSVISGLFYTSYSFNINITMKYTLDYATRMPTREKKQLSHGNNFHGIWANISRRSISAISMNSSYEYVM